MLENFNLIDEDYILTRYQNILKKQGILTVKDLLFSFPTKYENYKVCSINDATLEQNIVLEGTIVSKVSVNYLKNKLSTITFQMEVEGKKIRCTIFNRVFLKGKLNYGTVLRVQGHFYQNMNNFTIINLIICDEINRNIVPVYKVKDIAESKYLEIIEKVYRRYKRKIEETLPLEYIEKNNLLSLSAAIKSLHFADDMDEIDKALYSISFWNNACVPTTILIVPLFSPSIISFLCLAGVEPVSNAILISLKSLNVSFNVSKCC